MKKLIFFLPFFLFSFSISARNQVDTVSVYSPKMRKEIKNVVIVPENYSERRHYPVLYLLHGYSDNYAKWVKTVPSIKTLASEYQMILVCPDGGYSSWYMDSPIDSTFQYETYITKELLPFIDGHYSTIPDRRERAITGLSMGGFGALYIAIRNSNLFAHAGSMSGGVDLRYSPKSFDIAKRIGDIDTHQAEWDNRSIINMINNLKNKELDLIIDCGVSDFFYQINGALHRRLLALNIDHDYIERPGSHTWDYWANSIQYQMLYFDRCFDKNKRK